MLHSAKPYQLELIDSLQPFFADNILPLLTPVDQLWQPADFLPPSQDEEEYFDKVGEALNFPFLMQHCWRIDSGSLPTCCPNPQG